MHSQQIKFSAQHTMAKENRDPQIHSSSDISRRAYDPDMFSFNRNSMQ